MVPAHHPQVPQAGCPSPHLAHWQCGSCLGNSTVKAAETGEQGVKGRQDQEGLEKACPCTSLARQPLIIRFAPEELRWVTSSPCHSLACGLTSPDNPQAAQTRSHMCSHSRGAQILPKATPHTLSLQLRLGFREEGSGQDEDCPLGLHRRGRRPNSSAGLRKTSPRPATSPGSNTLLLLAQEVPYIWVYPTRQLVWQKKYRPQ